MLRGRKFSWVMATVLVVSCGSDTTGPSDGTGHLALVNTLTQAANAFLDAEPIDLPAPGESVGFPIAAGSHRLEIRSLAGQVLVGKDFNVPSGQHQTALIGTAASGGALVLVAAESSDTASTPPTSGMKIRAVHLADGTPDYESYLYQPGEPLDSARRYVTPFRYGVGADSRFPGYTVRPAGAWRFRVTAVGSTNAVVESELLTIAEGQVWSVILSRRADGALQLQAVRDNVERLQ